MGMLAGADKFLMAGGMQVQSFVMKKGAMPAFLIGNECLGMCFSVWFVCSKLGRTAVRKGFQGPHRCQAAVT